MGFDFNHHEKHVTPTCAVQGRLSVSKKEQFVDECKRRNIKMSAVLKQGISLIVDEDKELLGRLLAVTESEKMSPCGVSGVEPSQYTALKQMAEAHGFPLSRTVDVTVDAFLEWCDQNPAQPLNDGEELR